MSRTLLLLSIALGGGLLATLVHEPDTEQRLEHDAVRLGKTLVAAAADLEERCEQLAADLDALGPSAWMLRHTRELAREQEEYGMVHLGFRNDSLVCWSGMPTPAHEAVFGHRAAHVRLPDGIHAHAWSQAGEYRLHSLRSVWATPPIENRSLRRGFHPSLKAPEGLLATDDPGIGRPLADARGATMLRLAWREGALEVGPWLRAKFLAALIAAAALLALWWHWCDRLAIRWGYWSAAVLFITGVLAARAGSLLLLQGGALTRTTLFDPAVYATSPAFASLGDLLINAVLLVLMAGFVLRASFRAALIPGGLFTGVLLYAGSLVLARWITQLMLGLVNDSSLEIDPFHVQGLSAFGLAALLAMLLFFATWAMASAAVLGAWVRGRSAALVYGAALLGIALSGGVHAALGMEDPLLVAWPWLPLLVLVHALRGRPRFMHAVAGTALIALAATHLLTRHTSLREQHDRLVLAERLATREDPVVERLFQDVAPLLRRDRTAYALLAGTDPCTATDLDRVVRQRFFSGYWERYDVRLFAFGTNSRVRCVTDAEPPRSFGAGANPLEFPLAASDMPDLVIEEQPGRSPFYHARVAIMVNDTVAPVQLVLELHPRTAVMGPGFPELLLAGEDPLSRKASRYAYARYENGLLVEYRGGPPRPLRWERVLGSEGAARWRERGFDHMAKGDAAGTIVVLSLPVPRWLDKATGFSYLFALMGVLLALALALRTLVREGGIPALGIGAKVRLALLLFAAISLVFFVVGTRRLLTQQYQQRFEAAMLERARSVHQELQNRFDGEPPLGAAQVPYLEHLLARLGTVFFTDIIVYTTEGRLLASSRPQVFAPGLLGHRMDAPAYCDAVLRGRSSFTQQGALGTARYRVAFTPLRDRRGNVLAHIALPGFTDQAQRQQEQADLLVAVINLFVLLFALSVLVAVFISNWTTRPLDLLKNALSRVGLRDANEPIRYRGDDEIGQLVEVYNRKVEELRESADLLARSERESAWREMARQVAHEIKNPLTPMKLSIQHFRRTWSPDTPDAAEKLERFSKGLVEQIDTLSGIAGAFSDFAQMPRARSEDLDLAEVAEAALSVFLATPGMHCELRRESPGALLVHADREQLLRVFNNLLKNAVQAIPDGREGRITVTLHHTGNEAVAEVRDNGIGIRAEDHERIFRPNFTTKGSGMGLGLAMVQRMVEGAGGRVWFETEEGAGSTFFVALPLRKA